MPEILAQTVDRGLMKRVIAELPGLVGLAIPIIVGLVSGVLMAMIDTAMIAPLGPDVVAAAGLATSGFIIASSALLGFVSVIGVRISQASGANDFDVANVALRAGIAVALGLAVLIGGGMILALPLLATLAPTQSVLAALEPYWFTLAFAAVPHALLGVMRGFYSAINRPWVAVWFTLLGVALNVPLNLVFIYGGLGIEGAGLTGAGIASVLAKFIALSLLFAHLRTAHSMNEYRKYAPVSFLEIAKQLKEGLPVGLGSVSEGGAYAITGMLMASLGAVALAANQVVHSVGVIFYMVPIGMMIAVSIKTGQALGATQTERLRPVWLAANILVIIWSAFVFSLVLATRTVLSDVLSPDASVAHLARSLFLLMAFIQLTDSLQSTALGALRGISDNTVPNVISVGIYWAIALPLAFTLGIVMQFGAEGILAGYGIGVLIAAIVLQLRYIHKTRLILFQG
jgi:MATE family multidrug resistance protein